MIVFSGVMTFILLKLVGFVVPLRMSEEDMEMGDLAVHGHEVYPSDIPSLGFPSGAPAAVPAAAGGGGAAPQARAPQSRGSQGRYAFCDPRVLQATDWQIERNPMSPRSSSPTTAPTTTATRSRSAACSQATPAASLELAYVRHAQEVESGRERLAEQEADALLQTGAGVLGQPRHPAPRRGQRLDARRPARPRAGRERPT